MKREADEERVRLVLGADGKTVCRCSHCGVDEPLPAMPSEIGTFSAGLTAILERHHACEPKK